MNLVASLLLAPLLLAPLPLTSPSPPEGRWEGAVDIPGDELAVVVDMSPDGKGGWSGSALLPGRLATLPLQGLKVEGDVVAFTLLGGLGDPAFKGQIGPDHTFRGEYREGGNTAPFTLRRIGSAQLESPRSSTPVRREFEGEWDGDAEFLGNKQHAHLTLTNLASGSASGQFTVVGRREHSLNVELIEQEGDFVRVRAHEASSGAAFGFEGKLGAGALTGILTEGTLELPLTLKPAPGAPPRS